MELDKNLIVELLVRYNTLSKFQHEKIFKQLVWNMDGVALRGVHAGKKATTILRMPKNIFDNYFRPTCKGESLMIRR